MGLTSPNKPLVARFKHDCGHCQLIGLTTNDDVYFCSPDGELILRDGDEGGEFAAFPLNIARLWALKGLQRGNRWRVAVDMLDIAMDDEVVARVEE